MTIEPKIVSDQPATDAFAYSIFAALFAISAAVQVWAGADGDKEFCLYIAQQLLSGKKLYLEMFEPSPPLIFWMLTLPVSAAAWLGIMEGYALSIFGFLLCGISIVFSFIIARQHPGLTDSTDRGYFLWLLAFLFVVWVNPAHFADREHLIVVLIFPYILRYLPSLANIPLSRACAYAIGIMAGIGFCIKPQAAILFFAIHLLQVLRDRSLQNLWRPEICTVVGIAIAYLVAVGVLTPEYYTIIIPVALATYADTNRGLGMLIGFFSPVFTLAVVMCDFRRSDTSPFRRDIYFLLWLCVAALLYIATNNGWEYTFYPLKTLVMLLAGLILFEFSWLRQRVGQSPKDYKRFGTGRLACVIVLSIHTFLVLVTYSMALELLLVVNRGIRAEIVNFAVTQNAKTFGAITMNFSHLPAVANVSGAEQRTRFSNLWMFNTYLKQGDVSTIHDRDVLDYVAAAFAHDINLHLPDVIFVETTLQTHTSGAKSALLRLLLSSAEFSGAWQKYRLSKVINVCNEYEISQIADCIYEAYVPVSTRGDK